MFQHFRRLAKLTTFSFVILAGCLWLVTIIAWYKAEPGFEPINVAVGAMFSSLAALLSWLLNLDKKNSSHITPNKLEDLSSEVPERLRSLVQRNLKSFSEREGQLDPELHPQRAIQDELQSFLQGQVNGCVLLIGKGGTGKSSIIYRLAKWAVEKVEPEELPTLYLDAGQQQIQSVDSLATELGCNVDDLPNFPDRFNQLFGKHPLILIDTVDQLVSPEGVHRDVKPLLVRWSESTRVICACRSGQVGELRELLPSAEVKEIPKLTKAEIRFVLNRTGIQADPSEQVFEIITVPLFLYLWVETGAPPLDKFTSLWLRYWKEITDGRLANPQNWGTHTKGALADAKSKLLYWMAQQMFQQRTYHLLAQNASSEFELSHVAYDALIRAGTIFRYDVSGTTRIQFFHQRFFEFIVGKQIVEKERIEAEKEIDQLIKYIYEPYCRYIINELAHLAHQQNRSLEDYLYKEIIVQLGDVKMEMRKAQEEKRPSLPSASPISWGTDQILEDLIDHWGSRLCATLDEGSPSHIGDGEVASTIGSVFERNSRVFAVPSLIASMYKYEKRGRFIGALARVRTEEAVSALLKFTEQQLDQPTDKHVFRFLAEAFGENKIEESIPLLQTILDRDYEESSKYARKALQQLRQEEVNSSFELGDILAALSLEDEKGRPSDWKQASQMAIWLQINGQGDQIVQTNKAAIITALETALSHQHGPVRQNSAAALSELGNDQTFNLLISRLKDNMEPSHIVAKQILASLIRLTERGEINSELTIDRIEARFSDIRLHYSALYEEINITELRIRNILRKDT